MHLWLYECMCGKSGIINDIMNICSYIKSYPAAKSTLNFLWTNDQIIKNENYLSTTMYLVEKNLFLKVWPFLNLFCE